MSRRRVLTLLAPGSLILILTPAARGAGGELRFEVQQLRNDRGLLACALYASAGDFLKKSLRETTAPIKGGRATCLFTDVPPGTYAIAAYHDENANYRLDTNFLGIPREGVCASNNARGTLGPPRWKGAAFAFTGAPLQQQVRMNY